MNRARAVRLRRPFAALARGVLALFASGLGGCATDGTADGARLIAFGDSFTDQGNYRDVAEAAGAADAGRFTTNPDPMWIEHVARRLGLDVRPAAADGTNYAEGFARNAEPAPPQPGLTQRPVAEQVDRFLAIDAFGDDDVVLINGGGNDVLLALQADGDTAALDAAADAFAAVVERLVARGATELYVLRTPDLGLAPVGGSGAGGADNPVTRLVRHYNAAVAAALAPLLERDDTVDVIDPNAVIARMFETPAEYGLTDVVTPACTNGSFAAFACTPDVQLPGASETYLMADDIHLAGRAQEVVGEFVAERIEANRTNAGPLPSYR